MNDFVKKYLHILYIFECFHHFFHNFPALYYHCVLIYEHTATDSSPGGLEKAKMLAADHPKEMAKVLCLPYQALLHRYPGRHLLICGQQPTEYGSVSRHSSYHSPCARLSGTVALKGASTSH